VVWEGRSREAPPYPDHWHNSDLRNVRYLVATVGKADIRPTLIVIYQYRTW
jgi:hypothetical protein